MLTKLSLAQLPARHVHKLLVSLPPTIVELLVPGSGLTDDDATHLAQYVRASKSIAVLRLGFNKITHVGAAALGDALHDNASLTLLNLGGNASACAGTKAIAEGRYKAVNMAGAAVIAAVTNALEGREFPFVFGGDGASFAVGPADVTAASADLQAQITGVNDALPLTMFLSGPDGLVLVLDVAGRLSQSSGGGGAATVTPGTWSLLDNGSGDYAANTTISLPAPGIDLALLEDGQSYTLGAYDEPTPYSFAARDPGRALMPSVGWFLGGTAFSTYTDLASTQALSSILREAAWPEACRQTLSKLDALAGATVDVKLICMSSGQGGQKYPTLKKGSDTYNDWALGVDNMRTASERLGRVVLPAARCLAHGESDYSTAAWLYKTAEIQRHMDRETELSDRLGRTVRLPVLAYLPMRGFSGDNRPAGSSVALRELSLEQPGRWILYGPAYAWDHKDDQHPGNLGQRQRGAFLANALYRGVLGTGWRCTDLERAWRVSDTSVRLEIYVPDGGTLVEDRSGTIIGNVAGLTSAGCDGGFAVRDKDGDFNVVSAVKDAGANTILVTFNRAYHPGTTQLCYAMRSLSGFTGGTRSTGPRGIFRSSSTIPSIADSAEPLYHWLLPFMTPF
jgi:hypothetical protein